MNKNTKFLLCCALLVVLYGFVYIQTHGKIKLEIASKQILNTENIYKDYAPESYDKNGNLIPKQRYQKCYGYVENNLYDDAKLCYEKLSKDDQNINTKILYAVSMLQCSDLLGAQKELENVMKIAPYYGDTYINAKKILDYVNKRIEYEQLKIEDLKNDKGDYYNELTDIALWEHPEKIKVYIPNNNSRSFLLKKAFNIWDEALLDTLNFVYVQTPLEADIIANIANVEDLTANTAGVTSYEFYYYPKNPVHYFKKVTMVIADNDRSQIFSDSEFIGISLHEIGHSLGILSHSKKKGDIMFENTSGYRYSNGQISNRDINTVKKIYKNNSL